MGFGENPPHLPYSSVLGMLTVSNTITIPAHEIDMQFIRAQGAGGQHVNKTSTAVHLFFDIKASKAISASLKARLLKLADHRISPSGKVIIKSQESRSQEMNRQAALEQLKQIILKANQRQKKRIATKPTRASQRRRMDAKSQKGQIKKLRGRVAD